jgi:hypothetical protein
MELDHDALQKLTRAFLLGTGRGGDPPLPAALQELAPADAAPDALQLAALALLAQHHRFTRTWPTVARPEVVSFEPRLFVPDGLREDVRALLAAASVAEARESPLVARALGFMASHALRLHPFDLSRFETALRAWPHLAQPDDLAGAGVPRNPEPVTPETWLAVGPSRRAAWLTALRRRDPAAARALLERDLPQAPAKLRAEVVPLMAHRLGDDDREWLETLRGARSKRVKAAALDLLGRLPGTAEYLSRLERAAEGFSVTRPGPLARRRLTYRNKLRSDATCVGDTFGLRLTDLIAALALPEPAHWPRLDADVALAFAAAALHEGDRERVVALLEAADTASGTGLLELLAAHGWAHLDPEVLADCLRRLPLGRLGESDAGLYVLREVYPEGLPLDLARRVLAERPGAELARRSEAVVLLLPHELAQAATAAFASSGLGARARAWLRLLTTLGPPPPAATSPSPGPRSER